jgi:hypothetical protein
MYIAETLVGLQFLRTLKKVQSKITKNWYCGVRNRELELFILKIYFKTKKTNTVIFIFFTNSNTSTNL